MLEAKLDQAIMREWFLDVPVPTSSVQKKASTSKRGATRPSHPCPSSSTRLGSQSNAATARYRWGELGQFDEVLKCAKDDDVVMLKAGDDVDVLNLAYEAKTWSSSLCEHARFCVISPPSVFFYMQPFLLYLFRAVDEPCTHAALPRLQPHRRILHEADDIDSDTLSIPDTAYDARVMLPAAEFTCIMKDLSPLGESTDVVQKKYARFNDDGEAGMKVEDEEDGEARRTANRQRWTGGRGQGEEEFKAKSDEEDAEDEGNKKKHQEAPTKAAARKSKELADDSESPDSGVVSEEMNQHAKLTFSLKDLVNLRRTPRCETYHTSSRRATSGTTGAQIWRRGSVHGVEHSCTSALLVLRHIVLSPRWP
ncbi:hypothetical protein FIBSPDRAFT_896654 [Athelia psychrophila]|uniref:Proliferating cell nuclear antigen PCNA C-terminal domain-containing protein n=1 Tax=Athelia psychrophila TaxID=1759441 RepID=A0A166D7P2_9AGAM|nr:hypothetical protein FIBSPDRAFT_896654 [Fibularhizoctonia sp. CBS 109695]